MKLLTEKQVCANIGISRRTLLRWRELGKFPQPIQVGERAIRWDEADITAWIQAKKEAGK
jgi:prophage regulatory protein